MTQDWYFESYERLCEAVVKQAVYDYQRALRRLARHPHDEEALRGKEE